MENFDNSVTHCLVGALALMEVQCVVGITFTWQQGSCSGNNRTGATYNVSIYQRDACRDQTRALGPDARNTGSGTARLTAFL
ncbi:Protein of unknown function [Gryllus bimaculatus]|nr:Protein of unknown function [Gryllus bimaculatus]